MNMASEAPDLCDECSKYDWQYAINRYKFPDSDKENVLENEANVPALESQFLGLLGFGGHFYRRPKYPDGVFWKHENRNQVRFPLPSLYEMEQNSAHCSLCRLILNSVKRLPLLMQAADMARQTGCRTFPPSEVGGYFHIEVTIWRRNGMGIDQENIHFTQLIRDIVEQEESYRLGRLVQQRQIDIELLQRWWRDCQSHHKGICHPVLSEELPKSHSDKLGVDIRVIDVKQKCVIIAPPDCKYVALSYVWGQTTRISDYRLNFLNPGSGKLSDVPALLLNMNEVPKTIKDAIHVVDLIGETYLWVDAYCIFQDDMVRKLKAIGVMDRIYADAVLTIVAAGGTDSSSGLGGLYPNSRDIQQIVETVDGIELACELPNVGDALHWSAWQYRAWTYQENHFSKRKLIFVRDLAYYSCPCAGWKEDLMDNIEPLRIKTAITQSKDYALENSWPLAAFWYYSSELVEEYTSRLMSYPDDILNAFTGLMREYERDFGSKFCWGLPVKDFTVALLWRDYSKRVREKKPNYPKEKLVLRLRKTADRCSTKFPTWSWAGWEGPVYVPYISLPGFRANDIVWPWLAKSDVAKANEELVQQDGILSFEAEAALVDEYVIKDNFGDILDSGSTWAGGQKEAISLAVIDDPRPDELKLILVILIRQEDNGICYREGLMRLPEERWLAANPKRKWFRLG